MTLDKFYHVRVIFKDSGKSLDFITLSLDMILVADLLMNYKYSENIEIGYQELKKSEVKSFFKNPKE